MNARQFFDSIVNTLQAKGRTVEITETTETFGKMVWLYAPAPRWHDHAFMMGVTYSNRTKRWSLTPLRITGVVGKDLIRKSRTDISISADVYA